MNGILSFFQALPRILSLLDALGRVLQDHDVQAWMTTLETSIDQVEKAKTADEKIKGAQALLLNIRALK